MTEPMSPREVIRTARVSGVRIARAVLALLPPGTDPVPVLNRIIAELEAATDPLALPSLFTDTYTLERNVTP